MCRTFLLVSLVLPAFAPAQATASPPAQAQPAATRQSAASDPLLLQAEQFRLAWQAANRGDRNTFDQLKSTLQSYPLFPYLQYEDYRSRRAIAPAREVADFLDSHEDWAFTPGLRKSWLRALGERRRWDDLLAHAPGSTDTEVRCYLVQARIERSLTEGLLPLAQELWAVGQSQPDACDPVFSWLKKAGGITAELAWLRIRRAMEARNPRLTLYLARYLPSHDQVWAERWQQQDRQGYTRLDRANRWSDSQQARDITQYGLGRLARSNPDRAWKLFALLDDHFGWGTQERATLMSEIALWSAVDRSPATADRMRAVPEAGRKDNLLEWWARYGLYTENWADVILSVASMSEATRNTDRWRYWDARARLELGDQDYPMGLLADLSDEATYYGFLAADYLNQPYAICPQPTAVSPADLAAFRQQEVLVRVMELRRVGLPNWSRSEWALAMKSWEQKDLRLAAAVATEENWPNLAILALAKSGDTRWYEWRFPIAYATEVEKQANGKNLDISWVLGLMRSESAMAEDAVSSANARGLMQVTHGTARQLAAKHSYQYRGIEQLMDARHNIWFGTTFLRDLLDKYDNNPALAAGAYNAGPGAVNRWLNDPSKPDETARWIETLPYFETREYIPRVLAFATIYDWRRDQPVQRISTRLPALRSGAVPMVTLAGNAPGPTASLACNAVPAERYPGS